MRYSRMGAVLAMAAVVGSCADNPVQSPTAVPDALRFGKTTGLPCDAAMSRAAKAEQADLFEGAILRQAQTLWALVETACTPGNPDAANEPLLGYTRYVLSQWPAGVLSPRTGDKETNFLGHLDTAFPYVGYPAPDLPHSNDDGPLGEEGALGVITQSDTARELRAPDAALTLPVQDTSGDARAHLFAIYPDPTACGNGNLARIGPCFEVASFPAVSPRWSDEIKVGVCTEVGAGETPGGNIPALGHIIGGKTEIAGNLAYPADCGVHVAENSGSWSGGVKGIVTRLAWLGQRTFGVNTAYATHSGLGGIGERLSPWGGVDLQVFKAPVTVGPNVIGAFPAAPAVGSWDAASFATPPGSIVVKSSLGQYASPLIVMSQAGGACTKNCGGLLLKGNLFSASDAGATYGRYQITFVAVQDAPGVKEAPFLLTDSDGNELGRLSFVTRSSANQLIFNYNSKTGAGFVVGTWQRYVPETFKFIVDLNAAVPTVTLFVGAQTAGTTAPFRNPSATNLASISFDSRGIDSGVMGWDDIAVERLSDK